jgi:hypothetical protein
MEQSEQPRRSLDVGEEEGDGAPRPLGHTLVTSLFRSLVKLR